MGGAIAQTSGSVSLVSDYRFRGISLSEGQPEPQLNIAYDSDDGWYAGAFASALRPHEDVGNAQANLYAGYAKRLSSRTSWEAGITNSIFIGAGDLNYREIYTGLAIGNVNARLYFAPDYFGRGARTLYAEFNGSYPLSDQLHLIGHFGALHTVSDDDRYRSGPATRRDCLIGLNAALSRWDFQLAWIAADKEQAPYAGYPHSGHAGWTLSAAYSF